MLHILSHSPRSAINIHRSSPSDSAVYRVFFFLVVLVAQENIWDSRRIPNLHSDRKRTDTSGDERFRFGQQTSVGQIRLQVVDLYYLYYVNSVWT